MPEGDTIHRIANRLAPRLTGKPIERVTTQGLVRDLAGKTIASVTAHGKHLVIELSDGTHLRAHLGMYGRQRSYGRPDGEAMLAKLSPGRVSLALVTADTVDLWIGARTIEVSDRRAPLHGLAVASLGPDILADGFDPDALAASIVASRGRSSFQIGQLLLHQATVAGIGNIYRCETLFVRGIDPHRPVSTLSRDELAAVLSTARELMIENLGPDPRATRDRLAGDVPGDDRYFVYSRSGKPCRRCRTPIECYRLGEPPRWTWSCPGCQK